MNPNGDINGKTQRLVQLCVQLKYPRPVDEVGLRQGDPVALLPILHFVLLKFSRHVALCIHKAGYELQGKTDQKFVENAFRLFRDCFSIKTVLTPAHFLEQGFAERKLILVSEVIQACKKIHNDEIRKERLAALKTKSPGAESRLYELTRKSPEIKVVKNGVETRQVVRPQHLQNATDGGQSVFTVHKTITPPRQPDPPRLSPPPPAAPGPAPHLTTHQPRPHKPRTTRSPPPPPSASPPPPPPPPHPGSTLLHHNSSPTPAWGHSDLTFNPGLPQPSTPIHSWFTNPTFHEAGPSQPHTHSQPAPFNFMPGPAWPWGAWALKACTMATVVEVLPAPHVA